MVLFGFESTFVHAQQKQIMQVMTLMNIREKT